MGNSDGKYKVSRRELLKQSIAAGGLVWIAPTLLSQPVSAQTGNCAECPEGRFFRLKSSDACGCAVGFGAQDCLTTGISSCCLFNNGVTLICPNAAANVWTLAPGIEFCAGSAKGGPDCYYGSDYVTVVNNEDGSTTVMIVKLSPQPLSHSEIQVCVRGSLAESCIPV